MIAIIPFAWKSLHENMLAFKIVVNSFIGFKSGLRDGHGRTLTPFSMNHSPVWVAVWGDALSCWKVGVTGAGQERK